MSARSSKTNTTGTAGQGAPLGAPGSTGAFETQDPLGAPGSTGASPTNPRGPTAVGYDTGSGNGGQEQLHRPTATATGTDTTGVTGTAQKYAYGTAATTDSAGHHASVRVPSQTTDTAFAFGSGYDTGKFGATGGHGGGGYNTEGDKNRGHGVGGHAGGGGGYDTGSFGKSEFGHTEMTAGQRGGQGGGGYDSGSFGTADFGHTGVNTSDKELHRTVGGHGGGGYDPEGDKTHGVGHGVAGQGGISVVQVEETVYVDQGHTVKDHLLGSGGTK